MEQQRPNPKTGKNQPGGGQGGEQQRRPQYDRDQGGQQQRKDKQPNQPGRSHETRYPDEQRPQHPQTEPDFPE